MAGAYDLAMPRAFYLDPADANLTGFASNVTGAAWALTATSSGDNLAHQVSIRNDSANDKAAINITLIGTDQNSVLQTETITGPGASATVESTLYFLTLTSVTPASTWGADTADIGWVDEFASQTINLNWAAEDAAVLVVDVTGTIDFTLQQTFDLLESSTVRYQAIGGASAKIADGIWNSTGGATAVRLVVNSYSSGADIRLNVNQTAASNANVTGGGGGGIASAVTIADGADVALGSTTDDAYVGTEPYTAMSALRAIANAAISTAASPINITQTGGNVLAADGAAAGTTVPIPMGAIVATTLPSESVGDRIQLQTIQSGALITHFTGALGTGVDTGSNTAIIFPASSAAGGNAVTARTALAVAGQGFDGTQWVRQRGNTTGTIVIPPQGWQYAAASGGIVNTTTAVTIKASAGAGLRNYLSSLQLQTTGVLGAATEVAVRDGAGGTVLWRGFVPLAGIVTGPISIPFANPLVGSAATLMEFVTLTASITGGVYVDCQGYAAP